MRILNSCGERDVANRNKQNVGVTDSVATSSQFGATGQVHEVHGVNGNILAKVSLNHPAESCINLFSYQESRSTNLAPTSLLAFEWSVFAYVIELAEWASIVITGDVQCIEPVSW